MRWATRRSPVGSARVRVWALSNTRAFTLARLQGLFPLAGFAARKEIKGELESSALLTDPPS